MLLSTSSHPIQEQPPLLSTPPSSCSANKARPLSELCPEPLGVDRHETVGWQSEGLRGNPYPPRTQPVRPACLVTRRGRTKRNWYLLYQVLVSTVTWSYTSRLCSEGRRIHQSWSARAHTRTRASHELEIARNSGAPGPWRALHHLPSSSGSGASSYPCRFPRDRLHLDPTEAGAGDSRPLSKAATGATPGEWPIVPGIGRERQRWKTILGETVRVTLTARKESDSTI